MKTTSWTKPVLHLDIETYSEADLLKVGVYKYTEHPSFEILMIAYAFDDEEVDIIDLAEGEEIPEWLFKALINPEVTKTAQSGNATGAMGVYCRKSLNLTTS